MRIVHVSCTAPPEKSGMGNVAAREVVLLRARGIDAQLVAPESSIKTQETERSFIHHVKPRWRFGNAAILPGLDQVTAGADIIHLHYPFYGTAESLLWRKNNAPVVMTFHMDATADGFKGLLFHLHRFLIQPTLFDGIAKIFVSSFDYARHSSLRSWLAMHPETVVELPFGVDVDFYFPGPSVKHRFFLLEDAPTILFVGGLDRAHAFKGVKELLIAFQSLDSFTHLLIVGDGELRSMYEEQTRSLGIASRVHFLGRVNDETLRDAYRSSDVLVLPSTNAAEAFGLVALEAQACGIPVIASDLPGLRTIVRHGETGLLVPPNDLHALTNILQSFLADRERGRRMGERAHDVVAQDFSWDKHVDGLIEGYQECINKSQITNHKLQTI